MSTYFLLVLKLLRASCATANRAKRDSPQQSSFLGEFYLLFPQYAELGVDCVTLSVTQILFLIPKIMATFLYHLFPELQIYHRSFIYHMNK